MTLSKIVQRAVELAQVVADERIAQEAHLPMIVNLASVPRHVPTVAEHEFKAFLRQQTVAVIYTMLLIMYLGREKGKVKGFLEQYYQLRDTFEKPEYAIKQMLGKVYLVEHLNEGVKRLQKSGINIDTLETSS